VLAQKPSRIEKVAQKQSRNKSVAPKPPRNKQASLHGRATGINPATRAKFDRSFR
jgi:hypothetical protein